MYATKGLIHMCAIIWYRNMEVLEYWANISDNYMDRYLDIDIIIYSFSVRKTKEVPPKVICSVKSWDIWDIGKIKDIFPHNQ